MIRLCCRWNPQKILFESVAASTAKEALVEAVKGGADLRGANLRGANLYGANLRGANLYGANLYGANLSEYQKASLSIVPETGAFEGWKKCRGGTLVRLEIPAEARRSSATGRKCRADRVKVLEVIGSEFGISLYRSEVVYRVGEVVECDHWNEDRWVECGGGIHYFITRAEAEAFNL